MGSVVFLIIEPLHMVQKIVLLWGKLNKLELICNSIWQPHGTSKK